MQSLSVFDMYSTYVNAHINMWCYAVHTFPHFLPFLRGCSYPSYQRRCHGYPTGQARRKAIIYLMGNVYPAASAPRQAAPTTPEKSPSLARKIFVLPVGSERAVVWAR